MQNLSLVRSLTKNVKLNLSVSSLAIWPDIGTPQTTSLLSFTASPPVFTPVKLNTPVKEF